MTTTKVEIVLESGLTFWLLVPGSGVAFGAQIIEDDNPKTETENDGA